ncbi:MAG: GspE/PulE family protein [Thermoanaerobacteraceae bacterium]|nr:GspE/PulE family protein [Thermoanaerobacteraceae bacterium]
MIKRKLGDILLFAGIITQEQLNTALDEQKKTGERLGEVLTRLKYVTPEQIIEVLEFQLGIPHIELSRFYIDPDIPKLISENLARRHKLIPIRKDQDGLCVAMTDPLDIFAIDDVSIATGMNVKPFIATAADVEKAINRYYGRQEAERTAKDFKREYGVGNEAAEVSEDVANAPAVRLINLIIEQGIEGRASDIHIEPTEDDVRIRFRIDGELHEIMRPSKDTLGPIITRIKIMANLNIAEQRLPQDGRIETIVNGKELDIRVSVLPTINGEKAVLRLLDKQNFLITRDKLGLNADEMNKYTSFLRHPHGIILVTGPTGSGKTTTLYTMLEEINTEDKNIITVEDPVEYTIPGVNQVQVNEKIGLDFAGVLRSVLRQDPDIIMVGEIRDSETAEIAVRAAITGHLVLSTLHTNDAAGAVTRLMDMGVEPYLLSSSLVGVIAQRLVRKICPNCKVSYDADEVEKRLLGLPEDTNLKLYRGRGCAACNRTGYRGRQGIFEMLPITKEIKRLINSGASDDDIKGQAIKDGNRVLKDSARELVLNGITTLEEMTRLTYED